MYSASETSRFPVAIVNERFKRSKYSEGFTLWGVQLTFKTPFDFVQRVTVE